MGVSGAKKSFNLIKSFIFSVTKSVTTSVTFAPHFLQKYLSADFVAGIKDALQSPHLNWVSKVCLLP